MASEFQLSESDKEILLLVQNEIRRRSIEFGIPVDEPPAVTFVIRAKSDPPIKVPGEFFSGEVISLGVPSKQSIAEVDGNFIVSIEVPDLPNVATVTEGIADKVVAVAILADFILSRKINQLVRNEVILRIQKVRLRRAKTTQKAAKILKSVIVRTGRQRALIKGAAKEFGIGKATKIVAGKLGLRALAKGAIVAGVALDVVFISHRTAKGFETGRLAGALGGFGAGLFDASTFSLLPRQTMFIQTRITDVANIIGGVL